MIMTRHLIRRQLKVFAVLLALIASASASAPEPQEVGRRAPNILVAIADDWSFPHAGVYGDRTVRTPHIDRLAREGVLFTHAFVAAPSCTPSRAALLTGQAVHRLEEGANLWGSLPRAHGVYPDLFEKRGYAVGFTGKGWGPGRFEAGGRERNPAGPQFKNFDEFLRQRPTGRPFCFWFGSTDPHRPYGAGTGVSLGRPAAAVEVPGFLPDTPEVRQDLLDYYFEVERFDRDVGAIVEALTRAGELDNTVVIVTSDNGMPFPRAKATVYDGGTRVPLVIRWPGVSKAGTTVSGLVSLTDVAPTLFEGDGQAGSRIDDRALPPAAAARRDRNLRGTACSSSESATPTCGAATSATRSERFARTITCTFATCAPNAGLQAIPSSISPSARSGISMAGRRRRCSWIDERTLSIAKYFELATAKRPGEELYDLRRDPNQIANVAADPGQREVLQRLRAALNRWRRDSADPRVREDEDRWDRFPYYGQAAK